MSKLSFSQLQRFLMCGYSHHLHYKEKLRPTTTSAALLVGSALDEAINALLTQSGDAVEVFDARWAKGYIGKNLVELPTNTDIVYAESDFDSDIFEQDDYDTLKAYIKENFKATHDPMELFDIIKAIKKNPYKTWSKEQNEYYNLACWLSWHRKARYIIKAYQEEVLPKIKKVIHVQKEINMDNGAGDTVIGYIDLIAEWEDGKTYILDNKSSGRAYAEDAPSTKPQLHLYSIAENNPNVGFIVYLKNLEKNKKRVCRKCGKEAEGRHKTCNEEVKGSRCHGEFDETVDPKAKIQILLGQANHRLEEMVLENINDVNKMIKNDMYVKNLNSCDNWYGGKCPYYNKCHNNDETGLEHND